MIPHGVSRNSFTSTMSNKQQQHQALYNSWNITNKRVATKSLEVMGRYDFPSSANSEQHRVHRRRSSIAISEEKQQAIRHIVESSSRVHRERLEEERIELERQRRRLVERRNSLMQRWEQELKQRGAGGKERS
jgi:hypothetical protein